MDPQQGGLLGLTLAGLFSGWQATVNYLKWREELRYNYKVEREAKEKATKRARRLWRRLKAREAELEARIAELEGRAHHKPGDSGPRLAGGSST